MISGPRAPISSPTMRHSSNRERHRARLAFIQEGLGEHNAERIGLSGPCRQVSKAGAANKRPATEETVGRHGASVGDRRLGSRKAAYESRKDSAQSEVMRAALWPNFRAVACSRAVVQREINDEARSDRYRKHGHFDCEPRAGDSKCTALSPLSPCANLYLANLYPPKPRLGSARGRCAHCSVCQSE